MTIIHMQTDDVRWVAQQLSSISSEMIQQLEYLIGRIRSMDWQSVSHDIFVMDAENDIAEMAQAFYQLVTLSQRVSAEVDEWEDVDALAVASFKLGIQAALASGAMGIAGLQAAWSVTPGGNVKSHYSAEEQIRRTASDLRDVIIEAKQNWNTMTPAQKMDFLKKIEANLAAQQGRPVAPLRGSVDSDGLGESILGQYQPNRNPPQIIINEKLLSNGSIAEIMDTVAHEGRHAYQHYAVTHEGFHSDPAEVDRWRDNFTNYVHGTNVGFRFYRNQPIEADSFSYGDRFSDSVAPEGWLSERGEELVDWMGRTIL